MSNCLAWTSWVSVSLTDDSTMETDDFWAVCAECNSELSMLDFVLLHSFSVEISVSVGDPSSFVKSKPEFWSSWYVPSTITFA